MLSLRPYQAECVGRLRASYAGGHRAPLLALPTGAGKTVIFSHVAGGARAKGRRVLVVAHRRELIRQASEKLTVAEVPHGIICPGFDPAPDEAVQVGSVQTLARRLDALPAFDLIVVDEAHHAVAAQWRILAEARPGAKLLGVTATPARLDGKGLGAEAGGCFDDLVIGPSIGDLTADGYLSRARCFVPARQLDLSGVRTRGGDYVPGDLERLVDDVRIIGDAVEEYRRCADHLPAIAFVVSVAHGQSVAEAFQAAGYRAAVAHGGLKAAERDRRIAGLGNGEVEVLASCDLISEGLDVPAVGAVILMRPTKSVGLYLQQVGRGLRPAPGKDALIVLDHAGNVMVHGLPDAPRVWSLAGISKAVRHRGAARAGRTWRCICGCVNRTPDLACVACGEDRPGRQVIEEQGRLAEIAAERFARIRRMTYREMKAGRWSEAELHEFARARGYKPGWVTHRLREQGVAATGSTS